MNDSPHPPKKIIFIHYNHPPLTFSAEQNDPTTWSEHQTLPWAVAHHGRGHGRIRGGGRAGARLLAQAAIRRRDGKATEQQVHGGEEGL